MDWLTHRFETGAVGRAGPLQIMYGIDGRTSSRRRLTTSRATAARPPCGSATARSQLQLDIYGELIDSVYLYNKHGPPISHGSWVEVCRIVDWLCEHWDQADEGIWETRGGRSTSPTRASCPGWPGAGRAVARERGLPADLVHWLGVRDEIYHQIMARGWHPERGAFVQHYDTEVLDASILLMPLVKFMAPTDPMWLSTLDAIGCELVSDSLVYRYNVGPRPTAWRATRAPSPCARSGTSRRSPARGGWTRRGWPSRRCSPTPTTSGSTRRRSGHRRAARQLPPGLHPPRADRAAFNLDRRL